MGYGGDSVFFYSFLPKLLNMSLTASVVIMFVLLLRLLLKKSPKVISYALWGIVLFRLLCPVSMESSFSLFGLLDSPVTTSGTITSSIEYLPTDMVLTGYPLSVLPATGNEEAISDLLPQGAEQLAAVPQETPIVIAGYVWIAGTLAMGIYAAASYVRLRRKLVTASLLRDKIYLADEIASPFVLGLLRPKIYLPSSLREEERPYIVMHEQHHIRRLDHIIKVLAFAALCIHWFNPLVWVAFIMANRDMEMSCDEAVVKKMGTGILADYAASLLSLATGKQMITGIPLAFGEGDTKGRIRNLANWKKPAFWVVMVGVVICIVTAVCLLTNPTAPVDAQLAAFLDCQIAAHHQSERSDDNFCCLDWEVMGAEKQDNQVTMYLWVLYREYSDFSTVETGAHIPTVITAEKQDGGYSLLEYWEPRDGNYYAEDIRDKFPWRLWSKALDSQRYIETQSVKLEKLAQEHFDESKPSVVTEWIDYYNGDMQWDGRQEISLDAFPGVTFRWTPEKVEAIVDDEIIPLYTGMPVWDVFFSDLTGDGLPELCSTITIGSGIGDNRVIIYDYANGASYSLEDRMQYDYSLSAQNDRLIVTKQAFSNDKSGKVVERGYLTFLNGTIQIVPFETNPTELITGTSYVSNECIYLNPLSSYGAMNGDSGYIYRIGEDSFEIVARGSGVRETIKVPRWEWQVFPYTNEEWKALFQPDSFAVENIRDLYDETLYQPLTDLLFLLRIDEDLWLVELKNNEEMGTYLWSIYRLVPEDAVDVAS